MLKTIRSFKKLALKAFKTDNNEVVKGGGGKADEMVVDSSKSKKNKSKKLTCIPNIRTMEKLIFLTPNIKKTFNYLKQAFIKTLIFKHFD